MEKIKTITVCGPTASGKSALGVELAKRLNGEIVSADSMQIYKGMDIATAVPNLAEMQGIPHHLICYLDPAEEYSVAEYIYKAKKCIFDINSRNKQPIIVGGTGLYIDTLIKNITFLDDSNNPVVREELQKRADIDGIESLYNELKEKDPLAAEKIHCNNSVKIIRALEIYYSTGKTLTEQNKESMLVESPFDNTYIGLTAENRDYLYDRINKRVDIMLENGLLVEAENFYNSSYGNTSVQAIGYKELKPYIDGDLPLEECIENLKRSTRRYAKRQLTWFRRNEDINWFYIDKYSSLDELTDDVMSKF